MAYRKEWVARIPVNPKDPDDVLLWLMRESAELLAAQFFLHVTEFEDLGWVAPENIPPLGYKQLAGTRYEGSARFREFRVVAERTAEELAAINA